MTLAYNQVTLPSNGVATALVAAQSSTASFTSAGSRRAVTVSNQSGRSVFLGDASVTTSTGLIVLTGTYVTLIVYSQDALYGCTTGGTAVVSYLVNGA